MLSHTGYLAVVDFDFIFDLEQAGDPTTATVPDPEGSHSGVTVGHGIDLGQLGRERLQRFGLGEATEQKLLPYIGLRGGAAQALLNARPLTLSREEAEALDYRVYGEIIGTVAHGYNRASSARWQDILPEAATVLASVAIQYGPQLARRTPKFWQRAVEEDYSGMIAVLKDFGDAYRTRRHREAAYLERGLHR